MGYLFQVSGRRSLQNLSNSNVATLSDGKKIKVDLTNDVKINESKVIADIAGKSGVIHVIDKVLIPN